MKYLLFGIFFLHSLGISAESGADFIYFPKEYSEWEFNSEAGLALTLIPRALAEEEIRQIPLLDFRARLGFPYNFSLNARVSSVYLSNQCALGFEYSYTLGKISVSIGDDIAFWYGAADIDGFDVDAYGWMNYPHVSAGYDFNDFYLSLKAEALLITEQSTSVGGTELNSRKNSFAGSAFSLAIEQPFWNDNDFLIGIKLNYTKKLYQSWLAFPTFDDRLLYPEFLIGFIF